MIPKEAIRATSEAMACRWSPRSPNHPDCDLCLEAAQAALEAAAPYLRAQALEEIADLIEPFSGIGLANGATRGDVARWLRARAVTERGEG